MKWATALLVAYLLRWGCAAPSKSKKTPNPILIREHVTELNDRSRYVDMVEYLNKLQAEFGTLVFDNQLPSLYTFKGVALHNLHDTQGAEQAFYEGVQALPFDTRGWINLGETQTHLFKTNEAIEAFARASELGDKAATSRLLKAKGWIASYQNIERISAIVEQSATSCVMVATSCLSHGVDCLGEGPSGTEYTSISGLVHREISRATPNAASSPFVVESIAPFWNVTAEVAKEHAMLQRNALAASLLNVPHKHIDVRRRLKVGVISSDFGVHPVSSLIRGMLEFFDQGRLELYCFSVTNKMSWWGHNITGSVEHFIKLSGMNYEEAAVMIAETGVEILIDLNGHTLNTGLGIMKHRPAPVQISYLGLPTTTGASFIDYYIGDPVALPPEHWFHFTEKLMYLPPCYISTDYAQLLGGILTLRNEKRWSRSELKADSDLSTVSLLFGTFSNTQKLDLNIMHVWMNILSSFPDSKMFMVQHLGSDHAIPHLRKITEAFGVRPDRLTFSRHLPWLYHIQAKTAVDLLLDSTSKNGHTTGLDAVWAGIPMVTMAGGRSMNSRAGESIHAALESDTGLVYSLKEYEDLAIAFARNHHKLRIWRDKVERLRLTSTLFDTRRMTSTFTTLLESTWESVHVALSRGRFKDDDSVDMYNVYHLPERGPAREIQATHVREPTPEELVYLDKRQTHLEAAKGAGRIKSNLQHRFHPVEYNKKMVRGGVGKGDAGPPRPSNPHGDEPPAEFFDPLAYRIVTCTALEKELLKNGGVSQSCHPAAAEGSSSDSFTTKPGIEVCSGKRCVKPDSTAVKPPEPIADGREDKNDDDRLDYSQYPIPKEIFLRSPLILNIGGIMPHPDMVNVNAQPMSYNFKEGKVDVIRMMHDLQGFPNASVDGVYSSHSLEHAGYGDHLIDTLNEWQRVLKPNGVIMVSVPNLKTLARMYLDESFTAAERWKVTNMIFGGQTDKFDYHKVGFDESLMATVLMQTGFCNVKRVSSYNFIRDTSDLEYKGYKISLNVIANKCAETGGRAQFPSAEYMGVRIPALAKVNIPYTEYDPFDY